MLAAILDLCGPNKSPCPHYFDTAAWTGTEDSRLIYDRISDTLKSSFLMQGAGETQTVVGCWGCKVLVEEENNGTFPSTSTGQKPRGQTPENCVHTGSGKCGAP